MIFSWSRRLAQRLALDRPEARAWAIYDWANSAYITVVITAVFPVFFQKSLATTLTPADATVRFAFATAGAMLLVALLAPVLGAIADYYPIKKKLLALFAGIGVAACAALALPGPGDWWTGLLLFAVGNVGIWGSLVFYDALLPHVARSGELDRLSTSGYAVGYLGGGLILAGALGVISNPVFFGLADAGMAVRGVFVAVAVWWAVFSIPLLRRVEEPALHPHQSRDKNKTTPDARSAGDPGGVLRGGLTRIVEGVRILRRHPQAGLFLLAFLVYNDGIVTIIRMATVYGAEIGLASNAMIGAVVLVQFVGVPCAFLFGALAGRIGTRPALFIGIGVYALIALVGHHMDSTADFYLLALLVGLVQGGTQALSRSLFASLIPRAHSTACFGLFAVAEKAASVFGPLVFAVAAAQWGSGRAGVLAVGGFFVVGGLLLLKVDVAEGRKQVGD